MLKKTITYTDYNDVNRTEDFYFNLNEAELTEMQLTTEGGLDKRLEKIIKSESVPEIFKIFKGIVLQSYGEKSADGKRFIKSPELSEAFAQSEAYNVLFMELAKDEESIAAFVNGLIPKSLRQDVGSVVPINR